MLVTATLECGSATAVMAQVGGGAVASIIGQVKDESGAVLPGVTVTSTSPALQVPQVVGITNERGEYRLAPLPIGTYSVEYALAGFQTVRRENVRLTAGFIGTVDVVLKVGSVEESVTVSAASPVVDVTSTGTQSAFTQETLQLIPTGRNGLISLFVQTPSVRANFDVGGSASSDTVSLRVYGVNSESWQTLEGIVTTESRDTQGGNYFDYNTFEEARAQTLSNEANVPARGVYVNMIIKSGGDSFHGDSFGASTASGLQSNNIDDRLRAQGFIQSAQLRKRWDVSQDIGGPIASHRLWFYGAGRYRVQDRETLGTKPDGSPFTIYQSQAYGTWKLSYQMTSSNRLTGFYFWHQKLEIGGNNLNPFFAWESRSESIVNTPMGKVEWQGVHRNSLVTSLQYSFWRWTALRPIFGGVGPSSSDLATQKVWGLNSTAGNDSGAWRMCTSFSEINDGCHPMLKGSLSWYRPNSLLGNHELSAGFDYISNSTSRPWRSRAVGDYQLVYNNNAPFQIVTLNAPAYPVTTAIHTGMYVKDNWTRRRLTLNLGIRYANDNGFVPAQCRAAGQFAAAACTDRVQDTIWNSWSPRLYAAYDVTGDAKTVIKGGWGRFAHFRTTDEVLALNPFVGTRSTYRWHDVNGDGLYDPGEVNLDVNGPDFISSTVTDTSAPTNGLVNPNEQQPIEDEFTGTLERELMANFAVSVSGRYSRRFNSLRRLFPDRPYDAYSIPITKPVPGPDGVIGPNPQYITYYDFPAALAGRQFQSNELVNDPNATETFGTIELAATKRLSNRWQMMASFSATKLNIPVPAFSDLNPDQEINVANRTWETLGRLSGAYQFGAGITASFNFDHRGGLARARQVLFTQAGARVPSIVLNVEPLGSLYDPDTNILDLRLGRTFKLGGARTVEGQMNLFNALNVNTPTGVNYRSGPAFLRPNAIVLPRVVEFDATYRF
ncbi:MAG: carboxypeptidase regulatory-like domain-containing protein [Acidobacteria bacterium]|nr:carboxypeptidase regulatory-like domain-containing protein [Acidobacteriota bacterium]